MTSALRQRLIHIAFTFGLFSRTATGYRCILEDQRVLKLVNKYDQYGITHDLYEAYQEGQAKAQELYAKRCGFTV